MKRIRNEGHLTMSYFTLKSGEKLYYEDRGEGPDTLVMLHGWTSSHEVYVKPVETLQKQARCIIYDHRGHSGSKEVSNLSPTMETLAEDLHELIQGLGLSDVTLLGWSMGAGAVLTYVRLFGCENLKRIILCDMTPRQLNDDQWKLGLYQGRYTRKDMERDAGRDFYSLYKEFAIGAIPRLKKIPGFLLKKPLKKILSACDERTLKSLAASMKAQDHRQTVEEITVPVTYFYADLGSLFSPALADWYRDHVKAPFKAVCFPESTHMLVSDHPEKFAEEVGRVLSSN
jgi:pimeloyl-ACP methyl ester carboxylesterase